MALLPQKIELVAPFLTVTGFNSYGFNADGSPRKPPPAPVATKTNSEYGNDYYNDEYEEKNEED